LHTNESVGHAQAENRCIIFGPSSSSSPSSSHSVGYDNVRWPKQEARASMDVL